MVASRMRILRLRGAADAGGPSPPVGLVEPGPSSAEDFAYRMRNVGDLGGDSVIRQRKSCASATASPNFSSTVTLDRQSSGSVLR